MRKLFKWIGIVLGGLVVVLAVALSVIYAISAARLNKQYTVPATPLTIPTDAAAIAEGKRQFATRGCVDCHGTNGAGKMVINDPLLGTVMATNLTSGKGGVGQRYSTADWERAIRHGVGPDGRTLVVMPAYEYNSLNDSDLATLVAYIKALPLVDQIRTPIRVGLLGRVLHVTGLTKVAPAEWIDHAAPRPQAIGKGRTKEYGAYLAQTCAGCHGAGFSGGAIPGVPGEAPYPANLTADATTGLGAWQEADFATALRTGVRPDGTKLAPKMPWPAFKAMTDDEIGALWLYFQSLPVKSFGNR